MRNLLRGLLVMLSVVLLSSAASAAAIKSSMHTLKVGDDEVKTFLAEPAGKGPFPAIVVIQEWWGLNDWVKDQAKRLAGQGYVAIAPDLYRGKVTADPKVAMQLMRGLPGDRAVNDLKAAVSFLAKKDNVNKDRIGCIGWCMGGGYALKLGLADPRVKAIAICYGRLVTTPDELKPLQASVLGIFGADDRGIPPKTVKQFEAALKKANKKDEGIHIFKDAGHGFMRDANKNAGYKPEQTKEAWKYIDAFFAKTLKS